MGGFRDDGAPRYWQTARGRQQQRLALQQRRLRRRIAGECLWCGLPRASGLLCELCAIGNRERGHRFRFRKRSKMRAASSTRRSE